MATIAGHILPTAPRALSFPAGVVLADMPYDGISSLHAYASIPLARAALSLRGYVADYKQIDGRVFASYTEDYLYNRVWVKPLEIDLDFITEAATQNIMLWNAHQTHSVAFSSVTAVNPTGTTFTYPTLPYTLRANKELTLVVNIALAGPPLQETYYRILIDGLLYAIHITGIRVIGVEPEPDWATGIDMRYAFETTTFETDRFTEQRRPLRDISYRTESVKYLLSSEFAQRFFMNTSYGHDKVYGVPIYNEVMRATSIPLGGTTITLAAGTPTTNLWNLNNRATFVLVVDHSTFVQEVKLIDTIATGTITVDRAFVNTFNVANARIYPIFFGLLQALKFSNDSDNVASVTVEFKEFNSGA